MLWTQLGSGFLVDWERKKDLKNVFFLVYQLSPTEAVGRECPLSLASSGWIWFLLLAESQSASLQFCLQPPYYYLNQCQVGFQPPLGPGL